MKVKFEKLPHGIDLDHPFYANEFAAGADLRAALGNEVIILKPMQRKLVPTGLKIEIPSGFEGQIRPRSGLALKHGISLVNTPGTIDSDYRGELNIILINLGDTDFEITHGMRIAQIIFNKYEKADFIDENLSKTARSEKGFGSTGI